MKKIIYTLLALFCIGITSCDDGEPLKEAVPLNILESTVDFQAPGGEGYIAIENGNAELNVSSNVEWCKIKNITNDKITFNVTENNNATTRVAVIKMTAAGLEKQVSITQMGVIINRESKDLFTYVDNVAFVEDINFASTLPVTVVIDKDANGWLSYKKSDKGYTFTGVANDTGSGRMGKVTIETGSLTVDYYFLQYGIDDFCTTWKASFVTGGKSATDVVVVTKKDGNNLNINMQGLRYPKIKAVYEDGAIKIPCGQLVGQSSPYYIFFGVADPTGQEPGVDDTITCQLNPYLNGDKQWGLTFVDNGSWEYTMQNITFWATNAQGQIMGIWESLDDYKLNKN